MSDPILPISVCIAIYSRSCIFRTSTLSTKVVSVTYAVTYDRDSSQCRIRTDEDFGDKMRGSIILTNQGEINKKREEKHYCSTIASTFWEY